MIIAAIVAIAPLTVVVITNMVATIEVIKDETELVKSKTSSAGYVMTAMIGKRDNVIEEDKQ